MTETEWLVAETPGTMLRCLLGILSGRERLRAWLPWPGHARAQQWPRRPSDRKLRLYACACCRAVWQLLRNGKSRRAVETSERYADGEVNVEALNAARAMAWSVAEDLVPPVAREASIVAGGAGFLLGKVWPWAARAAAEAAALDAGDAAVAADAAVERAGIEWVPEGADIHDVAACVARKRPRPLAAGHRRKPVPPAPLRPCLADAGRCCPGRRILQGAQLGPPGRSGRGARTSPLRQRRHPGSSPFARPSRSWLLGSGPHPFKRPLKGNIGVREYRKSVRISVSVHFCWPGAGSAENTRISREYRCQFIFAGRAQALLVSWPHAASNSTCRGRFALSCH